MHGPNWGDDGPVQEIVSSDSEEKDKRRVLDKMKANAKQAAAHRMPRIQISNRPLKKKEEMPPKPKKMHRGPVYESAADDPDLFSQDEDLFSQDVVPNIFLPQEAEAAETWPGSEKPDDKNEEPIPAFVPCVAPFSASPFVVPGAKSNSESLEL